MATTAVPTASTVSGTVDRHRPFEVTLLVVFGYLGGLLMLVLGFGMLFMRDDVRAVRDAGVSRDFVGVLGVVLIGAGVVKILLTWMLGRGSEVVRVLFAILAVFSLASGLWTMVALHSEHVATGAGQVITGLLVLYLLLNHRSSDWFEHRV